MRLPGQVTAPTRRAPRARASSKKRSYSARPSPRRRWFGLVADHVDVGLVGAIRADEPDEEADQPPVVVLGDPRRAR